MFLFFLLGGLKVEEKKVGRKNKYDEYVKPYFNQIKKWLENGATEKQVAEQLGVAYSTFSEYKLRYPEFMELIKGKDMKPLIEDLKGALVKKALGFEYKEKKEYIKEDPSTGQKVKYVEITTKYIAPDTTAIFGALNIYDDTYVKDKANYQLKKEDLQFRKELAKANNFDLDLE